MIDSSHTLSIEVSVKKNYDQKKILKNQIEFLIQDLRQQISSCNKNYIISHILIENYILDDQYHENIPLDLKCNTFILQSKFICIERNFIDILKRIFLKYQIELKKIISTKYAKTMLNSSEKNLSKAGLMVINGSNLKEVLISSKKLTNLGFFERIFHIFS